MNIQLIKFVVEFDFYLGNILVRSRLVSRQWVPVAVVSPKMP